MNRAFLIRKRLCSLFLALLIVAGLFSDAFPGTAITVKAKTDYKVLLWEPYVESNNSKIHVWSDRIELYYRQMSESGINVILNKKVSNYTLTNEDLVGVDLVYILTDRCNQTISLLGTDNANVPLLRDYVNSGGRIIMNGEIPSFSSGFNEALSELAEELDGNFTITDITCGSHEMVLNEERESLTQGCGKIYPNAYAVITTTNTTAVWLMKAKGERGEIFAVDQQVGRGYITAFADADWLLRENEESEAAKQFLTNLLVDSAGSIENITKPVITGPQNLEWVEGDTTARRLSVSATAENLGTLSYQWHKGTSPDFEPGASNVISGATSAEYNIPNPGTMAVGKYYYKCVVTNSTETLSIPETSRAATVTVKEGALTEPVITGPQNLEWFEMDATARKLSVTATAESMGTLSYQWYKGNSADFQPGASKKINGATNREYSIPAPEAMTVGTYYYKCVVTNSRGVQSVSATSNAATVTVKPLSPGEPVISGPQNLEWFEGDVTMRKLSVTATATNLGTLSYQWYKGDSAGFVPDASNMINEATGREYIIPGPGAMAVGTYYYKCKVTNTRGGSSAESISNAATVTVKPCQPGTPVITGPQELEWYEGDETTRKFFVTVTAENAGTLSYQWYKGNSADFEPEESNKIDGATTADYTIPSPETMAVGTYYYKCRVTNTRGDKSASSTSAAGIAVVKKLQPGQPVITGPQNLEWYEGDETTRRLSVSATATNAGTLSYQWYEGNSADFEPSDSNKIDQATGQDYVIPSPETMAVGIYYYKCKVTNVKDNVTTSANSKTAAVTVKARPVGAPVITGPQNLEWYVGDSTQRVLSVTAAANNLGTLSYQWYKGTTEGFEPGSDNIISGATGREYRIPSPGTMAVGTYYYKCKVTNTKGNLSASTISADGKVKVHPRASTPPTPVAEAGSMEVEVSKHENTPDISVQGFTEDIAWSLATENEKSEISKGTNGKLWLEITNIDQTVNASEKQLIEEEARILSDGQVAMYMDFSMFFQLGKASKRQITSLNGKSIKAQVAVPENLRGSGKKRTYYLVSVHNGVLRIHGSTETDTIDAAISDFSTYAIIYSDEDEEVFEANITIKQTNDKIVVNWDKLRDVGKVDVFVAYCGNKYTKKPTKTTKRRSITITSIRGKKLNQKKNYKMYLVAYDTAGRRIGKSLSCHFAGKNCKYTNPKKLKLATKSLTVSVGQSAKINASIKYEDKNKKPLSERHAARFRYISDVPEIVAVDKNGYVTGISQGTCDVYVCCQNGLSKHVSVTVRE